MKVTVLGIPERWKRHRPLPADIEERLESLAPILRKEGGCASGLLSGSLAATDETSPRAPEDVDLAVLTKEGRHGSYGRCWQCLGHELIGSGGTEKGLAGAALSKSCAAAGRFMSGLSPEIRVGAGNAARL